MSILNAIDQIRLDKKLMWQTFVMQTTTGTLSARAIAKCSFDMPMSPAFAPTIRMTQEGAPDVSP